MIGKTRQNFDAAAGPPRGILRPSLDLPPGDFSHSRLTPDPALTRFIAHYWLVSWHLAPGLRQQVETLPHPNIHLVFTNPGKAEVHGIHRAKFTRILEGSQNVFGVKFRAGGFRPFLGRAVATLRSKTIDAGDIFAPSREVHCLARDLTRQDLPEQEKIALANRYFLERTSTFATTPAMDLAASLTEAVAQDPALATVQQLATRAGMSERSLQRLFHEYVGATPKWVILRYRMHELVERLHSQQPVDWAASAAELGYFDQSHLIRDFRRLTGYAPESYRKQRQQPAIRR